METRILGKADLLSADNLKRELVEIEELKGSVWMRELSAGHVILFKTYIDGLRADGKKETSIQEDIEIMSRVVSYSVCDEKGVLLFGAADEAKGLLQNNLSVIMRLGNKALALSGIAFGGNGLTSEVAANLPNSPVKSSSENLPRSSGKHVRKH